MIFDPQVDQDRTSTRGIASIRHNWSLNNASDDNGHY
jgi:hypothetical protein